MHDPEYELKLAAEDFIPRDPFLSAEDWIRASLALEEQRRGPGHWERPALSNLHRLCAAIGLPYHCGDLEPGTWLSWPETESGRIALYAGDEETYPLALIDRVTGYWRLRLLVRDDWRKKGVRTVCRSGLALTGLVALREGITQPAAVNWLERYFPARGAV
ncbi:hypothetical protein [Roseicella sp. DB1501]|uniref:hypothetical protein n=1 Tax=Roseicella sp. DB1501 TaxID=2730925 RepID=UPI0014928183|nr:hypothetical protein [Roseicella sp. DB1501]NOG69780.1 hypothetical protein [Roseicella sp. DB1501]